MNAKKSGETVYSISITDLQQVAEDVLGRRLTKKELASVSGSVGDYIDWFQAIEQAIRKVAGE